MFPVMLNLKDLRVLVVGAGPVGLRKAKLAEDAGAVVMIVDPTIPSSEEFAVHHLAGIQLVFACATAEVNANVVEACRERGIWVCDAIVPERGTFTLPAVVKRGELQIAVSTGGASPALARKLRLELEDTFDESYGDWVRILREVREVVLAEVADIAVRKELFEEFSRPEWLERGRSEGWDVAKRAMLIEVRRRVSRTAAVDTLWIKRP